MRDQYRMARVQMLHCSRKLRDLRGTFPIIMRLLLALGHIQKKGMVWAAGLIA